MPNRAVVKVHVEELTRYGYKDVEGYVSFSKNLTENDRALVVPGADFDAEYYVSDKGTRYLNKIVARSEKVRAPDASPLPKAQPKATQEGVFQPKFQKKEEPASTTMSKAEWQAKDRSQLLGGLCHDAAQLTFAAVSAGLKTDVVLKQYAEMFAGVIKLREEVK